MKNAILIDHEPWTIRRKQLFYDLFEKAGIPFKVWDLSQWLHPGFSNPDEINDAPYLTKVYNRKQFQELLKKENPIETIIIEEVFRVWKNRHVFFEIKKFKFNIIKIDLYGNSNLILPGSSNNKNILLKQFNKIFSLFKKGFASPQDRILTKIYFLIHKIPKWHYFFSSNSLCGASNIINHPDYENYKFSSHIRPLDERYIVFCDTYFPLHSDLKNFFKYNTIPCAAKYQNLMRNFFDLIEAKYKLPVIIAAHPKSNYTGNEFGNRKIIKYNTDNLVYYSDKVILHICNSISYSILGNKEIALVTTSDYLKIPHHLSVVNLWESVLGIKSQNIDNGMNEIKFNKLEDNIRQNYIFSYLTSPQTQNIRNSDIIKKFFEML